jgi:hypothetical protein
MENGLQTVGEGVGEEAQYFQQRWTRVATPAKGDEGAEMTTNNTERGVLLIGKSQLVLDESVAGLRELGYKAEATNDFSDITGRFDVNEIDLVVFGGQVPPDRKAELRAEIGAINAGVIFVQGLAGIPGLIINQVQRAFMADHKTSREHRPTQPTTARSG